MPSVKLTANEIRLIIDPQSLGFDNTSELLHEPLPWIGQERAENAASFGLNMQQTDYNLFVLGEVGSGRSSLLKQAMHAVAAQSPVPPDLCYLHNFETPERPLALYLPAGQGRMLRQAMAEMGRTLMTEIPLQLEGPEYTLESERIEKAFKEQDARTFADLDGFAEARRFIIRRESGQMLFTLRGPDGHPMTEDEMLALPREEREIIGKAEEELLAAINRYFEIIRPLERQTDESLAELRRQTIRPLLRQATENILQILAPGGGRQEKLVAYLEQVSLDILANLDLFENTEPETEALTAETLERLFSRYRVNLVVDNSGLEGAPVIVEDNPLHRALFGSIEYHTENEALVTDFSRIRAGSLLKAHGGFLMLHLRDLLADEFVWEKLRRFLRSNQLQIEEPGTAFAPITAASLIPEPIAAVVKIVLIGSPDHYHDLLENDPEFARRFRIKVDFAGEFLASPATHHASAVFVAQTCVKRQLPHFTAAAVARLLEQSHREIDDQKRQSALFGHTDAWIVESAALCTQRGGSLVSVDDVDQALRIRNLRHDYAEQRMREAILDGEVLIDLEGAQIGQVNGLSVFDLGDHCFGFPVRVSARTHAGQDGLTSIEREVEMSGPIHDKGVLILQHYLAALFARNAPLSFSASIVFEQEYNGIEGDSASCAELFSLLSALAEAPVDQGIAVTGALNQHGEILPVGGINEKIEGYFRICQASGLTGRQGVIIPDRNRRNLMLDREVLDAVRHGRFHLHAIQHVADALELLTGLAAGAMNDRGLYPKTSLLGRAQRTLVHYHRVCSSHERQKNG